MASSSNKREWVLQKESELRCEVGENTVLTLRLVNGNAEVFGVEMAPNKEYCFRDQNIAVFTWYGCTIEASGGECGMYVVDSTPMVAYVNTHIQLEARRDVAMANKDRGPRVIVVGPAEHGKSTVSQLLAAYALRLDRTPIYVDLDVGLSSISIPGSMAAIPLDKTCLSVEEGFTNYNPLIYFHGHTSPKDNPELYKTLVTHLAAQVSRRLDKDEDAASSGVIINTCGLVDTVGIEIILHCIKAFSVDIVLVMNHDKLYSTLLSASTAAGKVTVVKLPTSGGIVPRDVSTRKRCRKCRIRDYFYGRQLASNSLVLQPERKEGVTISSFVFLRAGGVQLSEGMRTVEKTSKQDECRLMRIVPTNDLIYSVLAVLHEVDPEQITDDNEVSSKGEVSQLLLQSNVAGYISILQMDIENDKMTILSPCQGSLPTQYLLVGSVKWLEN